MIDAMAGFLDVAVKHRGVSAQAQFVGFPMDTQPSIGVGLMFADFVTHLGVENLRAAAGKTSQAGFLELGEEVAGGTFGQLSEPVPFHRRVRLEVKAWIVLVNDAYDVQIPFVRQLMV